MGAAASVQEKSVSKWNILKKKRVGGILTKNAIRVLDAIYTELDKPLDGSDMPPSHSDRLHYHSVNEVRRLRQKLSNLTRVPEKDMYVKNLMVEAAARSAMKKNPEKSQRSTAYDRSRMESAAVRHHIVPSTEETAADHGMYAGGILRDTVCTTPRTESHPTGKLVPYAIFVRRAIINLSKIPTKASDGTKSRINRVLKVAEVDTKANLTLIDTPPTRPEPNVVTVLVSVSPDKESQMLKHFPTLDLPIDPDVALKCVRAELKRQWGLDAHVLSYHADREQDQEERGWRLFEVEAHDASWIPTRLIPQNRNYRSEIPPEQYANLNGNRGQYDEQGDLEYLGRQTSNQEPNVAGSQRNNVTSVMYLMKKRGQGCKNDIETTRAMDIRDIREIEIPRHYADWMQLDCAVGVSGLEALDVSATSRDLLIQEWHEIRELRYARERQHEALLIQIVRDGQILKRSPWRQLGWYSFAVGWIDQQLALHARDFLGRKMQRDGPMYQVRLTDTHCVFRCASRHHGDLYFSVNSKKSKYCKSSIIAKYMSDIKFWRRQVPYVIGSDDKLNFLLLQDVRWRLTTRVETMDDEDIDDKIYSTIYRNVVVPKEANNYKATQLWIKCLEAIAECQIDADFRSTRFKEMNFPIVDKREILTRWTKLTTSPYITPILIKQGHLRSDQLADLTSPVFIQKITRWLERLFVESRIPPLVLVHERFRPEQCFIAKGAGPRGAHLYSFAGIERSVLTHPFFALQRLMNVWPGATPYDSGEFLGDEHPCQRDRRLLRDNYLKCWKRWAPAGAAKRDFSLARQLWPLVEACRLSTEYDDIHRDLFNQHQRKRTLQKIAPVLRQCAHLAKSVLTGLFDNDESAGGLKKSGLRPVRSWPEGVVKLQAEDGSFSTSAKCNSDIDVRHLIWQHLEGSAESRTEEDIEVKSPRVDDTYVGFDAPLHSCGIRDGDTITFKIVALPPKADDWIVDELGRMRDVYKAWPNLPKVTVYGKGSVKKPRRPDILVESSVMPKKAYEDYQAFNKEAERRAIAGETAKRPQTPPCPKGEGVRRM